MDCFDERATALFQQLGEHQLMVLSTADGDHVTSRTVSVVLSGRTLLFQAGRGSRKCEQLQRNPRAALCVGNIQLEGVCSDLGHPLQNAAFCELYRKHYAGSFAAYSHLAGERLLAFDPTFAKVWTYEDGKPYEETIDFVRRACRKVAYTGE